MFRSPLKKKARRSGFGDYRAFKFSVYAMTNEFFPDLRTVRLDEPGGAVVILDQTRLPGEETYVELRTPEQIWEAIRELKVRGAPAIGVTAAYGIYVCCRRAGGLVSTTFARHSTGQPPILPLRGRRQSTCRPRWSA